MLTARPQTSAMLPNATKRGIATNQATGNAMIKHEGDDSQMSKPKIRIDNKNGSDETKYTESLHSNRWIDVRAKAKKVNCNVSKMSKTPCLFRYLS